MFTVAAATLPQPAVHRIESLTDGGRRSVGTAKPRGPGDEGAKQAGGGGVGVQVDLNQTALELAPGGFDRVAAPLASVEGHEPAVGLLGVTVELDDLFQGGFGGAVVRPA
jgi:hypothetical protein